ncbi:hypothetical protein SLS55_010279 [Diplodia seriata]|uniref:EKC/KEOPS complex subunit BUD32 n=1 Tax=Diplodia seriata TaxID=420778 RepID=A0ABR3BY34_9PEZI
MDASSLSILELLGEGGSSHVHKVTDGNANYACKVFLTKEAFEAEKAAYQRIQRVDALRGRVPALVAVPAPLVIILEHVEGPTLSEVGIAPSERAEIQKQLTDTLDLLHEAGVYHGDISRRNIIVKDGRAKLLDFSIAVLQEKVEEAEYESYAEEDHEALKSIFFEMGSKEAKCEALDVIDRMRKPCPQQDFDGEHQLEQILQRTDSCNPDVVNGILTVLPAPSPKIAIWVAERLYWRHRPTEAVDVLRSSIARCERTESSAAVSNDVLLNLREYAAGFAAKAERFDSSDEFPSVEEMFEDAVKFYLGSAPENVKRSCADEKVLSLRLKLANTLSEYCRPTAALRVCVRALEEARVSLLNDESNIICEFMETMKSLLEHVEDRELWDRAEQLIPFEKTLAYTMPKIGQFAME